MGKKPARQWSGSIPRQRFDSLLDTWHVQVHRRRTPLQLPSSEHEYRRLEDRYGIGEYSERKKLLYDALDALLAKPASVDFGQIWEILNDAKTALVLWYVDNNAIDDLRVVDQERTVILQQLHYWASRARRIFRQQYSAEGSVQNVARAIRRKANTESLSAEDSSVWAPTLKLAKGEKPKIVQCLDDLMEILNKDALFLMWRNQPSPKSSYRRPRTGAPSPKGSIVIPAARALAKAGAKGWIRESLLDATGITELAINRKHK